MATRGATQTQYLLQGHVTDRATQRGVAGVRVTAFDRDTKYNDMLGQVFTDEDGAFEIGFNSDIFGNAAPDNGPDVFYIVEMDGDVVLDTIGQAGHNLPMGTTRVTLQIDLPAPAPTGKDYVDAERTVKAIDWWQASDFRGVFKQSRDKTLTVSGTIGALIGSALKNFDFAPVVPSDTPEKSVVGQNTISARAALATNGISVTDVKPLSTLGTSGSARLLVDYPVKLNANDKVTLYEDDGVVKYYTRDTVPTPQADAQTVARIDGDVQEVKARVAAIDDLRADIANVKSANADVAARAADEAIQSQAHADELANLQVQLKTMAQANAEKDAQITRLQTDLTRVTKAQDDLANRIPLNRLAELERQIASLARVDVQPAPFAPAAEPVDPPSLPQPAIKRTKKDK